MNNILLRFSSRKFILAVAGAICLILKEGLDIPVDTNVVIGFVSLLLGFIVVEGTADAIERAK